jgi:single-strand DNA-binding protein
MTTQLAAWGRLGGDPKAIDTKSGKPMTVANLAADVGDEEPEWLGLVAFGNQAEALAKHGKGECISVAGRVQRRKWSDNAGAEHQQLQVVADSVISARTVRPGGGKGSGSDTDKARQLYGQADGEAPLR